MRFSNILFHLNIRLYRHGRLRSHKWYCDGWNCESVCRPGLHAPAGGRPAAPPQEKARPSAQELLPSQSRYEMGRNLGFSALKNDDFIEIEIYFLLSDLINYIVRVLF